MRIDLTLAVSLVASLITAMAAIIAPVVTARINSRASIRIREMEMVENGIRATIEKLSSAYSQIPTEHMYEKLWDFRASAFVLMSQVESKEIQDKIIDILKYIDKSGKSDQATDLMMADLMRALVNESSGKSR